MDSQGLFSFARFPCQDSRVSQVAWRKPNMAYRTAMILLQVAQEAADTADHSFWWNLTHNVQIQQIQTTIAEFFESIVSLLSNLG
jgi:hypothetical protein